MPASSNARRKLIGKTMQALRKRAGFKSAKAFAEKIGINPNTYTQYEQGMSGMSYETAWDIADALDCTLDALGGRDFSPAEYSDPGQAELNACYENMNVSGKDTLVSVARSMERDTANRIEKDSPESAEAEREAV